MSVCSFSLCRTNFGLLQQNLWVPRGSTRLEEEEIIPLFGPSSLISSGLNSFSAAAATATRWGRRFVRSSGCDTGAAFAPKVWILQQYSLNKKRGNRKPWAGTNKRKVMEWSRIHCNDVIESDFEKVRIVLQRQNETFPPVTNLKVLLASSATWDLDKRYLQTSLNTKVRHLSRHGKSQCTFIGGDSRWDTKPAERCRNVRELVHALRALSWIYPFKRKFRTFPLSVSGGRTPAKHQALMKIWTFLLGSKSQSPPHASPWSQYGDGFNACCERAYGCGHTERWRGGPCRQTGQPVLHPACSVDVFPAFSMYSDTLQETQHAAQAAPFTGWIQKPFREDATPLNGTEQEKKTCRTHEICHNHWM